MTERQPVHQFFGDAVHAFHLTGDLIVELERRVGCGVGNIFRRFLGVDFGYAELTEVLRLGLIGGGMDAKDAATLVNLYANRLSILELYNIALPVLEALMNGASVQPVAKRRKKARA
jgi:hypothetical protein